MYSDEDLCKLVDDDEFNSLIKGNDETLFQDPIPNTLGQVPAKDSRSDLKFDSKDFRSAPVNVNAKLYCCSCGHFVSFGNPKHKVLCNLCADLVSTDLLSRKEVRDLILYAHRLEDQVRIIKKRER